MASADNIVYFLRGSNELDYRIKTMNRKLLVAITAIIIAVAGGIYFLYGYLGRNGTSGEPEKWCQGVKIVFFAGGNMQDPFAVTIYNGAKAAEADLGPNVEYVWSDWDSDKMVLQFENAINESPDAISIMGHPGSEALSSFVDEAESKNIIVTLANVDLPDIRVKYTNNGFGYVGQALYDSGLLVSKGVVRKYNSPQGTEAIVFGVSPITDPSRYQRTKGVVDGLKEAGLVVDEITISPEVNADTTSAAAEKMIADALAKYPAAKIIIADHGALTASMPGHLKDLGKKPGEIIVGGFDLSANTVAGIENGYIGLIQDQEPYLQGYLPILQACLTKKYGFAGLYVDTGVGLIDSSNVYAVAKLAEQEIR